MHVAFQRERHNVRFQTVGDFQGLFAASAVRLRDRDFISGRFEPMRLKELIVGGVQFACGVIGYVRQFGRNGISGSVAGVRAATRQGGNG